MVYIYSDYWSNDILVEIMMKKLIKILKGIIKVLAIVLILGTIVYFLGPRPAKPTFPAYHFQPAASLAQLESDVQAFEDREPGIKPLCKAKIVWADSTKKAKTPVAMVYLHGFGASREEGAPVHEHIAKTFGANIFLARMDEHGVEEGEGNLYELTADSYVESAERALAIASQLGDSVIILATSAGGALGLFLASRHPEIKAVVTWSPCIRLASGLSGIMAGPWGLQISRQFKGGKHNDWVFRKPEMVHYWTNHQCLEGPVQFATFLETAIVPETFAKIKCPVFAGYYFRDDANQDKIISVAAIREMMTQLGTPVALRREASFPNANDHVIASSIVSQDWQGVERESIHFLREVVGL